MSAHDGVVAVERSGDVLVLTLTRGETGNAIDSGLLGALGGALTEARRSDAGAVVIAAAGSDFCVGLAETTSTSASAALLRGPMTSVAQALRDLDLPVVAAVNGAAIGAGLAIALLADVRVASPDARFAVQGELVAGLSWLLQRALGAARAAALAHGDESLDAEEARRLRLVAETVAPDALVDRALAMATSLAGRRLAFTAAKRALARAPELTLAEAMDYESYLYEMARDEATPS
jgi:2-(1,2-epoxy-1,2-dihydrophenyl)acetyl-CoA isomerase